MSKPKSATAVVFEDGERKLYPVDLDRDPLAELEAWRCEHKDHWVSVTCDDGYGAGGWSVDLYTERRGDGGVSVVECGGTIDDVSGVPYFVYVVAEYEDGTDWAGIEATILAAVDHARRVKGDK